MSTLFQPNYLLTLFILIITTSSTKGLIKFTLPKTDVVHPKSGVILHYLSEYYPANKIVTFTVTIPMYSDMCYLVPSKAMGKIFQCLEIEATMREIKSIKNELRRKEIMASPNHKAMEEMRQETQETSQNKTLLSVQSSTSTTSSETLSRSRILKSRPISTSTTRGKRKKRFLPAIIAIGTGIASAAISAVNSVQIGNLKSEMRGVRESLSALHLATLNNEAQIIHLNEGQIKLAQQLKETQSALNKTIEMVNQHADILRLHATSLRTVISQTMLLRDKLATATQVMETHFIHESIENILANKLNLYFVHHQDLPRVVGFVANAMNLSRTNMDTSIPLIEIITRLLVRQQIDFIPTTVTEMPKDSLLIGKLVFTSYFAAPEYSRPPFSIYEVVPIPFRMRNQRMILAKMPTYLGIEQISQNFIRWSKEEASTCDVRIMPSCRESPIRRKEFEDDCLYQILTDSTLADCRTELYYDKVFIHQVGQYWAISTYNTSKCHAVPTEDPEQHMVIDNDEITIPEIALITTQSDKVLACDRFIIPKRRTKIDTSINLIYNESIRSDNSILINLQEALNNDTHWKKLPYISNDMQAVLEFLNNTPKPIINNHTTFWESHPISLSTIAITSILLLVVGFFIFYVLRLRKTVKANNNITFSMPSMKILMEKESNLDPINTISKGQLINQS